MNFVQLKQLSFSEERNHLAARFPLNRHFPLQGAFGRPCLCPCAVTQNLHFPTAYPE